MNTADIVNLALSSLTVIAQIIIVYLALVILIKKKNHPLLGKPFRWIEKHGIAFALIIALVAMLGSLTYSDILGYEPCKLCWYQRIFMYPLVPLLGLALWRKEKTIIPYAIFLAIIGEIIAIYHYIVQLGLVPAPCSVSGYSVSCAKVFILRFGYITIPLMAFTAFILILFFLMQARPARDAAQSSESKLPASF